MLRRSLTALALVPALALPATANGSVSPDDTYGTAGTAAMPVGCSAGTIRASASAVGYGGRYLLLAECGGGYYRLSALDATGHVDLSWANQGHLVFRLPAGCSGDDLYLHPTSGGAVFLAVQKMAYPADDYQQEESHACLAEVLPTGKLAPTFGGSSAFRHLDRVGVGANTLYSLDVDAAGRLLVFSQRTSSSWRNAAAFVNRYTTSGKLDPTFSSDGQVAITQKYQTFLIFAGVYGTKPVVAVTASAAGDPASGATTSTFTRLSAAGTPDPTFGYRGNRTVTHTQVGNATIDGALVDGSGRIIFVVHNNGQFGTSRWWDVVRLSKTGVVDTAFADAFPKVPMSSGQSFVFGSLGLMTGHYVVTWERDNTDFSPPAYGTTGLSGDGSPWTALGANGTTDTWPGQFAKDRAAFYDANWSEDSTSVAVTRSLVQE